MRAAAARLLGILVPVCVLAATVVAVLGLFRVVGGPGPTPVSQQSPALRLGATGAGARPAFIPTPTPAAAPKAPTHPGGPEPLTAKVVVVNASGITGLAGRTASALRLRGVRVAAIGNLSAAQRPVTRTVFYPPGSRGQAQALATLSQAPAVAPTPEWLRSGGSLVLVVTDAGSP